MASRVNTPIMEASTSPPPKVDPRRFFSEGKSSEREIVAPTRSAFALAITSGSIG